MSGERVRLRRGHLVRVRVRDRVSVRVKGLDCGLATSSSRRATWPMYFSCRVCACAVFSLLPETTWSGLGLGLGLGLG